MTPSQRNTQSVTPDGRTRYHLPIFTLMAIIAAVPAMMPFRCHHRLQACTDNDGISESLTKGVGKAKAKQHHACLFDNIRAGLFILIINGFLM